MHCIGAMDKNIFLCTATCMEVVGTMHCHSVEGQWAVVSLSAVPHCIGAAGIGIFQPHYSQCKGWWAIVLFGALPHGTW